MELKALEEHKAAVEAARFAREDMIRRLEEVEILRVRVRQHIEDETRRSEEASLRAEQLLLNQQQRAALKAEIEQTKIKLAQEDLTDIERFPTEQYKVAQLWLYRRMSLAEELENIQQVPLSLAKAGFRITEDSLRQSIEDAHSRWRIPDHLRKYFKWVDEDGTVTTFT